MDATSRVMLQKAPMRNRLEGLRRLLTEQMKAAAIKDSVIEAHPVS